MIVIFVMVKAFTVMDNLSLEYLMEKDGKNRYLPL